MTLSNPPAVGNIACAQSDATAPSLFTGVASRMQSVLEDLTQLATIISKDRKVHIDSKDLLRDALVLGDGFIDTQPDNEEEMDEGEHGEAVEEPLFMDNNRRGDITQAAYIGDGVGGDEMVTEDDDLDLDSDTIIKWLNGLGPQIIRLHSTPANREPCPHLAIKPKDFQNTALAKIEYSRNNPSKLVIIGDPPGLGKTLPAMMAVVKAIPDAHRFSIVVVPLSCVEQWQLEFEKFFLPDAVRVFVLRDPNTSPLELLKYDVVLVTYSFVMSQYRKLHKYVDTVAKIKQRGVPQVLERPGLSIFSEIFYAQEGVKCPYIILDESNAIKNTSSVTFAAILELRQLADVCVMLTGSPVDNTWIDLYGFLQFGEGHSIRSKRIMLDIFASKTSSGKIRPPIGNKFRRLLQLLNSFIVRRPEDTIALPALHEQTITFRLDKGDENKSNHHYSKYSNISGMNSKDSVQQTKERKLIGWRHLTKALQYALHPQLVLIMHLARYPSGLGVDQASADQLYDAKEIEQWTAWRENLKKDGAWKSSRITAVIDVFNERRDIDPECGVLIFDESVYFLDIVQIAFANMYDPVECMRYDGRETSERRAATLEEFKKAPGPKVLLISRAVGGVGLNITAANVVILCGPWWKSEREKQAIKLSHRVGQTREVYAFRVMANCCGVEAYKAGVRDKKDKHNSKIISHITRKDGDLPLVWDNLD
ncbi:hypothetical protein G7Y89_g8210 [Cudoniella acicularis]|uniref:Uncharacterized protein n=1 Tax=Cudoniella acicularis TaxID=354080 RepID=A0A8H4RGZ4_9HELO|nr:hypothetical protein G7Y89_g8210 [Cudoniella acicularis]